MTLAVEITSRAPIPLEVTFRVAPGELLALVGRSGAGKSTVLRGIAGLWTPDRGRISAGGAVWFDGRVNLPPHRRSLGFVFQSPALFPHMTAEGNVLAAMPRPDRARAAELLALVNLPGLANRRPAELSGGQQQRVAIARALARNPQALLLDEPFSAVDRPTREALQAEIIALRDRLRMPVVLVTHDLTEAQMLADRMLVLEAGRVVSEGPTGAVMADPAALRALGVTELAAFLSATVAGHDSDGMTRLETGAGPIVLPAVAAPPGTRLRVRILAHEVILSRDRPVGLSAQNILPGVVRAIDPGEGPGVVVWLDLGGEVIPARVTTRAVADLGLAPGVSVHAVLKAMSVARDQIAPEYHAGGPDDLLPDLLRADQEKHCFSPPASRRLPQDDLTRKTH